jgi:preprotein translocase subunit SecA
MDGLKEAFHQTFSFPLKLKQNDIEGMKQEDLRTALLEKVRTFYEEKEKTFSADIMRDLERFILLRDLDTHWKDHLLNIDHIKEGIGLRAYAQKNPLLEYKREAYELFIAMLASVKENAVRKLFAVQLAEEGEVPTLHDPLESRLFLIRGGLEAPPAPPMPSQTAPPPPPGMAMGPEAEPPRTMPVRREGKKVGRNDPCPCGSGKKYKKCCGA